MTSSDIALVVFSQAQGKSKNNGFSAQMAAKADAASQSSFFGIALILRETAGRSNDDDVRENFDSIPLSMFTLFQCHEIPPQET